MRRFFRSLIWGRLFRGRLFWRFFFVSWLTILASGLTVGSLIFLWIGELPLPQLFSAIAEGEAAMLERIGADPAMVEQARAKGALNPFPWPLIPIFVASLTISAILANHLAKPIRALRRALDAVAEGQFDTRIAPRLADHSAELAGLGRGFDHMAEQIQLLVSSQRRLLHDVSHELRSPLARLHAAIGLARQDNDKLESVLGRVEREAERLEHLVGELLTLSALDASKPNELLEEVDLMDLVASISADADFEAGGKGGSVRFSGSGEAWTSAYSEALHRAFENVVRNAVKFSEAGAVVEVEAKIEDGQRLIVTTADRGPGVDENELEAIFEAFHSAGPRAGSGLGLAIARRAVEIHGGTISARHRVGGGLLVEIEIPIVAAETTPAVRG